MTTIIFERLVLGFQACVWILVLFWGHADRLKALALDYKDYSILLTLGFLSFIYTIGLVFDNLCLACEKLMFFPMNWFEKDDDILEVNQSFLMGILAEDPKLYEVVEKRLLITKILRATFINVMITLVILLFKTKWVPFHWRSLIPIIGGLAILVVFETIFLSAKGDEAAFIRRLHGKLLLKERASAD